MKCPHCQMKSEQVKNGLNPSGSQRWWCKRCQRSYTPQPLPIGYAEEVRQQAIRMYVDGLNLRRIARLLKVNHQSVANWVNAYVAQLPPAPSPQEPQVLEQDELFTFIGNKKSASI